MAHLSASDLRVLARKSEPKREKVRPATA